MYMKISSLLLILLKVYLMKMDMLPSAADHAESKYFSFY